MSKNLTLVSNAINQLPNNIEAEQAVIGSVLISNEILDDISSIISEINFYDPLHQRIYSAINSLIYKGMLANPITLKSYFENEKDELTEASTVFNQAFEHSNVGKLQKFEHWLSSKSNEETKLFLIGNNISSPDSSPKKLCSG